MEKEKCFVCKRNVREVLLVDDIPCHDSCFKRKYGKENIEEMFRNLFKKDK